MSNKTRAARWCANERRRCCRLSSFKTSVWSEINKSDFFSASQSSRLLASVISSFQYKLTDLSTFIYAQVEQQQTMIRIVGLSATLPNYVDVARFLRVNLWVSARLRVCVSQCAFVHLCVCVVCANLWVSIDLHVSVPVCVFLCFISARIVSCNNLILKYRISTHYTSGFFSLFTNWTFIKRFYSWTSLESCWSQL